MQYTHKNDRGIVGSRGDYHLSPRFYAVHHNLLFPFDSQFRSQRQRLHQGRSIFNNIYNLVPLISYYNAFSDMIMPDVLKNPTLSDMCLLAKLNMLIRID